MTFAPESRLASERYRLDPKGKYRTCFLERPHDGPIKVGRNGRHTIEGPGILTTRSWLNTKHAYVGNCKNGWTIVEVGEIIEDYFYDPFHLDRWPSA